MISNFFSSSSSLLTKEIIFSVLAALGGLVVLRGLWLEYISTDEKRYENADINGFRALKSKEKRGEIWVLAGIGIEIIIAVLFAALDVKEKHDINIKTAKNDPMNQPIVSLSAHVAFLQTGTNRTNIDPINFETRGPWVVLRIGNSDELKKRGQSGWAAGLFCSSCQLSHSDTNLFWFLDFSQGSFGRGLSPTQKELTVTNATKWDMASLLALFLPSGTEIMPESDLTIIVNGVYEKRIHLTKQIVQSVFGGDSIGQLTVHGE